MVHQGINVKVKLQNLSSQSVLINKSNRLNSEDSTQCYNSKLATDSAQPINTKYDFVSGNAMFSQNNQYNKRKLLIFHQNIRGLCSKTNEILCHFSSESPIFYVLLNIICQHLKFKLCTLILTPLEPIIVEIRCRWVACVYL
jgi:hypothetical protein